MDHFADLQAHPILQGIPLMNERQFRGFKQDIAEHGLLVAIDLYEDMILDGRARYRACMETGQKPRFRNFKGDAESARKYCISMNIIRGHWNKAQQVMHLAMSGLVGTRKLSGKHSVADAAALYGVNRITLHKACQILVLSREMAETVLRGEINISYAMQQLEGMHQADE